MPDLYIITGSNGAGKSSIGPDYLPEKLTAKLSVFDGDLLYTRKLKELFPSQVKSPKYAKQEALKYVVDLFEEQTESALLNNDNYLYEGHFINDETWQTPIKFKDAGYTIHLVFLGLENPDVSEARVAERVTDAGHYVDRQTIEANFYGNLQKLNIYYYIVDELTIIDTTDIDHRILYQSIDHSPVFSVPDNELPEWFKTYLPNLIAQ